ncbi:MAG: hypothetical protein IPH44_30985 [Myxococcales bacterium]|nr:hypothetical protein [Myxococcales bacterium]MBK7195554.1 hypothetical protein [Myxococcales bacterium]MBP6844876.1 hypothetical protein [Kofleriaceae bacterium]
MTVVAYAICRQCAAVFPAERRCPGCDGDQGSAEAVAAAIAHASEPVRDQWVPPRRRRILGPLLAVSAIMLGVGVGLGWAVAADTGRQPLTMSATGAADR